MKQYVQDFTDHTNVGYSFLCFSGSNTPHSSFIMCMIKQSLINQDFNFRNHFTFTTNITVTG